jgi:hypothetical protein
MAASMTNPLSVKNDNNDDENNNKKTMTIEQKHSIRFQKFNRHQFIIQVSGLRDPVLYCFQLSDFYFPPFDGVIISGCCPCLLLSSSSMASWGTVL